MAEQKSRLGGRLIKFSAILAVLGVVVAAVIVKGFEQADVKLNSQNLWILHKDKLKESSYYGLVNPGLRELTSLNSIASNPGAILQSADGAALVESNNVKMADIDLAAPRDFAKDAPEFKTIVDDTTVAIAGSVVTFFGAGRGSVSYSKFVEGKTTDIQSIGRPESLGVGVFSAATISTQGIIYAFSASTGKVYEYDTLAAQWLNTESDAAGAAEGSYQMSAVGDKWILLDQTAGRVWVKGAGSSKSFEPSQSAKLQSPSPSGSDAYFSTAEALFSINLGAGDVKVVQRAAGVNSVPSWFEGSIYAAWLNASDGVIFNTSSLKFTDLTGFSTGKKLGSTLDPVIQTNGSAAILNDAQSGWAWSLADGSVIPSTQDWNKQIVPTPPDGGGGVIATTNQPPVANDDSFGARPDTLTTLPVILNDTDPNPDDVLTIDPKSVTGWDESKGTLRISADGQSFSLLATDTVKGSTSFAYQVSDGSQANGTLSKTSATVSVTFISGDRNSAPVWCSDAATPCVERESPSASVLPGQSVSVPFVDGFIDPEGDKVFITSVSVTSGKGNAGFTPRGEVVFKSTLSKGARETAKISVTVSDTFGATATKSLSVQVDPKTELGFKPFVVTTIVGQAKVIDILPGVTGATGQVTLSSAKKRSTAFEIVPPTSFKVEGSKAEQLQIAITFTDEKGVSKNSFVQVNVIEDNQAKIAVSPVTVLVRAGLDSTVDLYSAISNPSERSLIITLVEKKKVKGAQLEAGSVKGGSLRLRGQTTDKTPGKIGEIRYSVSDGTADPSYSAQGQITVYQVSSSSSAPIAINDSISLRVETTGDINALANDLGTSGVSLVINPNDVSCQGTGFDEAGGIAFASGGVLRIVAPTKPGFYLCTYRIYSSDSPSLTSTANFAVNVTTKSDNTAPIAQTVKARVTSFATVEIPIPLKGIDPDGDTVSITGVGRSSAEKGYAGISAKGNSVLYTVIPGQEGQDSFTYTVSDGKKDSTGLVKIGIFAKYSTGGPVTMVDVVNLVAGSGGKAELDPTANDFDAVGKGLTLVPGSVKPNLKAGTDAYKKSAALISEAARSGGGRLITVTAAEEVSQLEYIYSVKDSMGNEPQGVILVRVTKTAVPDHPQVLDTYVDARERDRLATDGVDVRTNKVTWLTGNPSQLKLTIVGNSKGFRVSGQSSLIGSPPSTATFVVFKLSGKNFANEEVFTYGIMHIPSESKVISRRDSKKVWEVNEGETDEQDLLDWVAVPSSARVEIDGSKVRTSGKGRPEGSCTFVRGTTVRYSSGNGGDKFDDVCVVPIRYVGEKYFTDITLGIHVIAKDPKPFIGSVTVVIAPSSTASVDLKGLVSWDKQNPNYDWNVRQVSGSSISKSGPNADDLVTFEVVSGAEAGEETKFSVGIGEYQDPGIITVVVGESPNSKPSATLTFDNKSCNFEAKVCLLKIGQLTGVVNAFPQPLKFVPFGYSRGTPDYSKPASIGCLGQDGKPVARFTVVDENTIKATWAGSKTVSCPELSAPGALLDFEKKKGELTIVVDLQGAPESPEKVEQVDFTRSSVTLRITAGDFTSSEFRVTRYVVFEGNTEIMTCERKGLEATTTCAPIEDLKPFNGRDKENLHTYLVKAKNKINFSEPTAGVGIYAYASLKPITTDVVDSAETVLGRETATDLGVLKVTLTPRADPLASKYFIRGEGGTKATELPINGNYASRTFEVTARPGEATTLTVRAEGAVPPPVRKSLDSSTISINVRVAGSPKVGAASAAILGNSAPYVGKITLANVNRNYSVRTSKVAYVFWVGVKSPSCIFDEPKNTLTVQQLPGAVVKFAEDKAFNDPVVDLTSSDIQGLQPNTSYQAKVCYSNGFKVVESVATGSFSSIASPDPEAFKYKVGLASSNQSVGPYLYSWVVKLTQKPSVPAGLKPQFSSTKSATDKWMDEIYSDYWNERPIIKVRYCNLSETICSGSVDVKPESDTASWQVRIGSAFLAETQDPKIEMKTCSRPQEINFGVIGDNVSGWNNGNGGKTGAIVSGEYLAEYQLSGSDEWVALDDSRTFFRIPRTTGLIKKFRFWFSASSITTVDLEKVQVTIDVNC